MSKRIIDMVREKRARMVKNPSLAAANMVMGIAAIQGGIGSREWKNYMMQFVEQDPPGEPIDKKRLDRLMGTDNTLGDLDLSRKRSYLVGNSTCNGDTPSQLAFTVYTIDAGLDGGCGTATPPPKNAPMKRPRKKR